jgi:hypothetical protein
VPGALPLEPNERPDLCGPCGGACCRTRPGLESPERFLAAPDPAAALAAGLASGEWVVVRQIGVPWVDGVPPPDEVRWREILCLRPATVAERAAGAALGGGEPSPCAFLGDAGCRLPFAGRPRMCQALEPSAGEECVASWDRGDAARAWLPWQDLVADARRRMGR